MVNEALADVIEEPPPQRTAQVLEFPSRSEPKPEPETPLRCSAEFYKRAQDACAVYHDGDNIMRLIVKNPRLAHYNLLLAREFYEREKDPEMSAAFAWLHRKILTEFRDAFRDYTSPEPGGTGYARDRDRHRHLFL